MDYTEKPDYGPVIDICTGAALRELTTPALLAVLMPIIIGFGMGKYALGGYLAAIIVVGALMANFLSNAGGAWDNGKKYIEEGNLGGKGSDVHTAVVIGDTVGDPFKDTAGPAISPLIKVMNLVSLLVLPAIIRLEDNNMRYVVAGGSPGDTSRKRRLLEGSGNLLRRLTTPPHPDPPPFCVACVALCATHATQNEHVATPRGVSATAKRKSEDPAVPPQIRIIDGEHHGPFTSTAYVDATGRFPAIPQLRSLKRRSRRQDACGLLLGRLAQSRRQVHDVTDHRVLEPFRCTDESSQHLARGHSDPGEERPAVLGELAGQRPCGPQGTFGMIVLILRRAEEAQCSIALELVDPATLAIDHRYHCTEEPVQHLDHRRGLVTFGKRGVAPQIHEQHGHGA